MLNNQFYNQNESLMPIFFFKLVGSQVCLYIESETEY
jgi:hypothetical protein